MTPLHVAAEVADALAEGRAVVALESSLIAHGLPAPENVETARAAEDGVRESGAVPATVALDGGRIVVGADASLVERLGDAAHGAAKAASRDLAPLLAARRLAATTVSATLRVARMAGIDVFATGGIGGVHRGASTSFDVSSDIDELAVTPAAVVCSGAKSILDLPATLELLETRRVPIVGLGTDELPAFYSATSGLRLAHRVDGPAEAAVVAAAHLGMPGAGAMLFVQPPPVEVAIGAGEIDGVIERATREVQRDGVTGAGVTPAILRRMAELSAGATLRANIGLIVNNARFAGRLAGELAERKA
ncbi:MAG: pseudouridine-5'-phosphate glycosidase [Candidatus Limnocylindria bacterium]